MALKHPKTLKEKFLNLLKDDPSPHQLALGLSFGIAMALSPFLGLHLVGALGLCLLFGGNKLAASISVWVVNPLTFAPTLIAQYFLGCGLLPKYQVDPELFHDFMKEPDLSGFWRMGAELFVPYLVGSVVSAVVFGVVFYFIFLTLLKWMKKNKIILKK